MRLVFLIIVICNLSFAEESAGLTNSEQNEMVVNSAMPTEKEANIVPVSSPEPSSPQATEEVKEKFDALPADDGKKEFDFFGTTKTFIKNPFKLRDPFKRPSSHKRIKNGTVTEAQFKDGVFSNIPSIEGVPLKNIKIVGILLGKERRAMAKVIGAPASKEGASSSSSSAASAGPAAEIFILKEGMKLGTDGAELKAILPGGVVLLEKIRNVYDQDEYIETIIPVTSE